MKQYKVTQMSEALWNTIEDYDWPEDEILVIEKKDAYCMDITANGKRIVPILRKIEKAMTDAGLAGESGVYAGWFGEWANSLTDRQDRKYFIWNYSGRQDIENGCWSYSWGIEQIDDDRWYIFLNIAKPQDDTPSDNVDVYIEKPTEDTEKPTETTTEAKALPFEIRQIEAWNYDGDWTFNDTWHMGEMTTKAQNIKRAFTAWIKRHLGISFKNNRTLIEYDGDCYTIIDRKTKEPLFIAIPNC